MTEKEALKRLTEVDNKVDRALAFLDELNEQGAIEYSDYSALYDLISDIYCEWSVEK